MEKLKTKMRAAFLPYNYTRTIYTRLQNLRQGSRTVDDYATYFFALLAQNDLTKSNDQLVSQFIGGMRLQVQNTLLQFNPKSVSEALQRALLVEQSVRGSALAWNSSTTRALSCGTTDTNRTIDYFPGFGEQNRSAEASDNSLVPRNPRLPTFKCFGCGEQGHRQSACTKANKRGLFGDEEPVYDDYGEEPRATEEEERVEGDVGTILVIRRNYLMPHGITESWLRTNIFRSSCTI